jgi:hypothetical protein
MIANAGNQTYALQGGALVSGTVNSIQLPSNAKVDYRLEARVTGLRTSGDASIMISAETSKGDFSLQADVQINGEVPAGIFPLTQTSTLLGPTYANCDPSKAKCNSEIPFMFTGVATIRMRNGGEHQTIQPSDNNEDYQKTLPIGIESAYWNPFGKPIVITSLESQTAPSIFLVVTYEEATIQWSSTQVRGVLTGTLGSTPASGYYTLVTNSQEDLFAGKEEDSGNIAFTGSTPSLLNSAGRFSGDTTIPTTSYAPQFPYYDCSAAYGLPTGTCTATGALSSGTFKMHGSQNTRIDGSYNTMWSVPSLFTATIVIGAVEQQ